MSIFVRPADFGAPGGGDGGRYGYSPVAYVGAFQPSHAMDGGYSNFGARLTAKDLIKNGKKKTKEELEKQKASFEKSVLGESDLKKKADLNFNIEFLEEAIAQMGAGGVANTAGAGSSTGTAAVKKPAAAPAPPVAPAAGGTAAPPATRGQLVKDEVCKTDDLDAKLKKDTSEISSLKDQIEAQTKTAIEIQTKVKSLRGDLARAEKDLAAAKSQLAGKTGEHEGAQEALNDAQASVKMCSENMGKIETSVGTISAGLETLSGEIETLGKKQAETLAEFEKTY